MATDFATTVDKAVAEKQIAGGAAIVIDATGDTLFSHEFGKVDIDNGARPFKFDTTFWIASSTKLLTSICALQCVENGLLNLDDDVGDILPQWKIPQILTGFGDDGKPQLVTAKGKITLRRLLTHSSGMTYYGMHPKITRYRDSLKLPYGTGEIQEYENPLVFEPGTSWVYGVGIDWAGQCVEKVTGLRLREYMQKNIFDVLGMPNSTFQPESNTEIMSRMTGRVGRNAVGQLIKEESGQFPVKNYKDDYGGSGLYTCANDYIKVLRSLLLNDKKLLRTQEIYDGLFTGTLENPDAFKALATDPLWGQFLAPGYDRTLSTKWDYTLGGAVVNEETDGQASKGTIFWSGLPNNYWFIDRDNGVAGYYAGWLLPAGDAITGKMFQALQRAARKEAQASKL